MLWEIDIHPAAGQPDLAARRVADEALEAGWPSSLVVHSARGFLIEGDLNAAQARRAAQELLVDPVVERAVVGNPGDAALAEMPAATSQLVHILPKPGVMDPVAQSTLAALADLGIPALQVRTLRKVWLGGLAADSVAALAGKVLANEAIEQVVLGPLRMTALEHGERYQLQKVVVPLAGLDDAALVAVSRRGQLSLTLLEMQAIATHFRQQGREPTDAELESIAQTWSEHCSHKTLKGRIRYRDEQGERQFENLLKETIFAATQQIRRQLGAADWCVSVFADNAGVVRFDEVNHLVFKVETHNHPSAIEPYGGANTGVGGVIRDPLGTGLGARPIFNTDVFCFAPPDLPAADLPPGTLHPKRILRGVVAGVRDYGNRMGIPTVNGALFFDRRYVGNPLVFCGTAGLLPVDKVEKHAQPGDLIVAVGGRTGRDGIHGATFSSIELTSDSESLSGGAVQIGNAITEKMLLDVVLAARDRGLYNAITDCGAGGFSSAVGEMGADVGAEVWLDRVPLKYEGLSYTEIWISEAQERMVLSVPPHHWEALNRLCQSEGVEATVIGRFEPTGKLRLLFKSQVVADLSMDFLHEGRPTLLREAVYQPPAALPLVPRRRDDYGPVLCNILSSLNVASKEWVIRQYDHEVQGGSVVKPLVGACNDGPSDAAVVRPVLGSRRGVVVAGGMNPRYGDLDTYHMAASALDEAVRNCVAVGADPRRIAVLDNFCWGNTDRPETLGSLVRAALACHDLALALGTPFISGKDSLYNEFSYTDEAGRRQTVAIPPSLLISAIGQIDDVTRAVTMDFKEPGNRLYLVGTTRGQLGGSHYALVEDLAGGDVPTVDGPTAQATYQALHAALSQGLIRACHDLSEGGLAVAAAEMSLAGRLGADLWLERVPRVAKLDAADSLDPLLLFDESNSRFLCEVPAEKGAAFEECLRGAAAVAAIGAVAEHGRLRIHGALDGQPVVQVDIGVLLESWQAPLRW